MPRPSKAKPNAIVASAARVVAGRRKNRPSGAQAWQSEAWGMLDVVGELEFYRLWISNAIGQCTLEVVEDTPDGEVPATDPVVLAAMDALFGGDNGQPEMLAAMGGHIAIPGETWLVGLLEPSPDPSIDTWRVLSHDEVKEEGNRWLIDRGDGEPERYTADEVYITRIWNPHPRKYVQATSSVRAALPILRQLVGLSKRDAANIDSRLIGNGILAIPTEITFASPSGPLEDGTDLPDDPFLAALVEAGTTAIEDPGSPEALFPLLVRAPAEHLDKIKHITLHTPLDEKAIQQQEKLIKRLANSLDVPAEILTGMADVNHWTGWLLDENAIKMHVEPKLAVIGGGLTTRYLWPCLQGNADSLDPALRRFRIRGVTAALRQRPNRSADANAAHDADRITDKAWARETGFQETDLLSHPDNTEEFKRRLLVKAAAGVQTADVTVAAINALGVPLTPKPSEVAQTEDPAAPAVAGPAPRELPAAPTDPRTDRTPPQDQAASLLAVSEVMVLRAVEKGWARARGGKVRKPVSASHLDEAMRGAWEHVPRAAVLTGVSPDRLRPVLDTYARHLLSTGADHDPRALSTLLIREVLTPDPIPVGS